MADTPKKHTLKRRQSNVNIEGSQVKKIKGNDKKEAVANTPGGPKAPHTQPKNRLTFSNKSPANGTPKTKNFVRLHQTPGNKSAKKLEGDAVSDIKSSLKAKKKLGKVHKNKLRKQTFLAAVKAFQAGDKSALSTSYSLDALNEKIAAIEGRTDKSKNGRRRVRFLKKIRAMVTGNDTTTSVQGKNENNKQQKNKIVKAVTAQGNKSNKSSADIGIENDSTNDEDASSTDDEETGEDSNDDDVPKIEKANVKAFKGTKNIEAADNKSRYCVFVGNLPFDADDEEIKQHFTKVGEVVNVRIPPPAQGQTKPRGFAYVEFKNEKSLQKALTLHHSFLKNRRINVEYTIGGNKKGADVKKQIVSKNLKLQAMNKNGLFAGGNKKSQVNRNARRKQQNKSDPISS